MRHWLRCPIHLWLVSVVVIAIVVAGFLMLPTAPVSAAPEEQAPLDCLSCHTRVLRGHDKLGSGSEACQTCHDRNEIGTLRLFDGRQLPLVSSTEVCRQCHSARYEAWQAGSHGSLAGMEKTLKLAGAVKMKCIDCHNPHQPKMELSLIINPSLPSESAEGGPLECLSCHTKVLAGHDKLGEGSEACRACHSNTQMGVLHLAGGETVLPLSDSPRLCAQCHQKRYEDWTQGTHGMPAWKEGAVEIHGTQQVGCISCHDPHQPQVALLGITKPHPAPTPPPSPPPLELLIMVGIALLVVTVVGVALARQGEGL